MEPELNAHAAILSPESGLFDSHGYMLALQGEIEDAGGSVVTSAPFEGAEPMPGGGFSVRVGGEGAMTVTSRLLVTAPGPVGASRRGAHRGLSGPRHPGRSFRQGRLFPAGRQGAVRPLIYPPPIPGALGTHYRKDLGGQGVFGPDLAYVEVEDYSVDPAKADEFARYIRRFWPGLPDGALMPDYAGIRPKLHGPGEPQPDFQLHDRDHHGIDGLVALFGIESPGLTSSLAIGEAVADALMETQ